jgi:hypothetical protein
LVVGVGGLIVVVGSRGWVVVVFGGLVGGATCAGTAAAV